MLVNVEVNFNGAYGSDGWQVVETSEVESLDDFDVDAIKEMYLSVVGKDGESIEVKGAEYRLVVVD